jgi:hypothetical protein
MRRFTMNAASSSSSTTTSHEPLSRACMSGPPNSCMVIFSPVTISTMRGLAMTIALPVARTMKTKSQNTGV